MVLWITIPLQTFGTWPLSSQGDWKIPESLRSLNLGGLPRLENLKVNLPHRYVGLSGTTESASQSNVKTEAPSTSVVHLKCYRIPSHLDAFVALILIQVFSSENWTSDAFCISSISIIPLIVLHISSSFQFT